MLPIETTLERNHGADKLRTPYIAHVTCNSLINFGPNFEIPIRASFTGMKKTLSVTVCGFRLQSDSVEAIPAIVERLIEGVASSARLPHYVFIARDAGIVYPVYTVDDEVFAPTPNGPLFKNVELAKVRDHLGDYLHEIKVLGANGRTDKLHVRGINQNTLQLVRPSFYLKKRSAEKDNEFWAPVFEAHDSSEIYAYAASARREADLDNGLETLLLHQLVAEALVADKRLKNKHDLRVDRLFETSWQQLKANLTELEQSIVANGIALPTYQTADQQTTVAVEYRPNEDRYSLFLGKNVKDVQQRAEADYIRRGKEQS